MVGLGVYCFAMVQLYESKYTWLLTCYTIIFNAKAKLRHFHGNIFTSGVICLSWAYFWSNIYIKKPLKKRNANIPMKL